MKFLSPLISDARKSLGGTTYARNPAGLYARAKKAPIQPRTPSQQANRANFASATQAWKTLTQAQVVGWNNLAAQTTWKDTLGQTFTPSGMQLFTQCQQNLLALGAAMQVNPPASPPQLVDPGPLVMNISYVSGALSVFDIAPPFFAGTWASAFVLKMTPPLSANITFIPPYKYRNFPSPPALGPSTGATAFGSILTATQHQAQTGYTQVCGRPMAAGSLLSFTLTFYSAPSAGQVQTMYILTGTSPTLTRIATFTVAVRAGALVQSFTAGIDFAPVTVAAGSFLGQFNNQPGQIAYDDESVTNGVLSYAGTAPTSPTAYSPAPVNIGICGYVQASSPAYVVAPAAEYISMFGLPPIGSRVTALLRVIDDTTGFSSAEAKATTIVTGT
jgi:hypothetical protein